MAIARSGSSILRIGSGAMSVGGGGGGGSGGHGYTVTHYVAPFAEVAGASSDGEDQGATAWTNASSSSTPCTFGTAIARAAAGNVVECADGTYSRAGGSGEDNAAFVISASGSSGNPIIFVAQNPAAYNTTGRSKFRNTATPSAGVALAPVIKMNSYVIIDGFWFDYADGGLPSSRGVCASGFGEVDVGFRRLRFDRTDLGSDDDGDNFGCLHLRGTNGIEVSNCQFIGGYTGTLSENEACVETYGARNLTIEHNYFEDVALAFYIKGTDGTYGSNGSIRYNKIKNCGEGFRLLCGAYNTAGEVAIYQNLIYHDGTSDTFEAGIYMDNFVNTGGSPLNQLEDFRIYNNTIDAPAGADGTIYINSNGGAGANNQFENNICVYRSTTGSVNFNAQRSDLSDFSAADLDYNCYYENGNTVQYYDGAAIRDGIVAWRAALGSSKEANSIEANPVFVDAATGDFRLDTGSPCLSAGSGGVNMGCYISGTEEIGLEASPSY